PQLDFVNSLSFKCLRMYWDNSLLSFSFFGSKYPFSKTSIKVFLLGSGIVNPFQVHSLFSELSVGWLGKKSRLPTLIVGEAIICAFLASSIVLTVVDLKKISQSKLSKSF